MNWNKELQVPWRKGLSDKKKSQIFLELSVLINSGLDLKTTLELVIQENVGRTKASLQKLMNGVLQGSSLSEAMYESHLFSKFESYSVKIGEETGKLGVVFESVARFYENKNSLRRQLISAISYPIFVLSVAVFVLYFMIANVVPMFANILSRFDKELPWSTKFLIELSNQLQDYGVVIMLGLLVGVFLVIGLLKKPKFKLAFHRGLIRIPMLGEFILQYFQSQFSHSMHLLLSSRVPLNTALELTAGLMDFLPMKMAILKAEQELISGTSFYEAVKGRKVFGKRLQTMVNVGESTGDLTSSFSFLSTQLSKDFDHKVKMLNTFLEPLLIVFISLVVGGVLISMYLPLFSLTSVVE